MRALAAFPLLALLVAGCTTPTDGLGADSYVLETTGIPDSVEVGEPFTFTLAVAGAPAATTTHMGAHYWATAPADPTAGLGDAGACQHFADSQDVPGTFEVTCTFDEAGEWHVYGHLRLEEDGQTFDYWADGEVVTAGAPAAS